MSLGFKYQVFGSPSSVDLDICFFVEKIGSIQECKIELKNLENCFNNETSKCINGNLCVIENGVIITCFKGAKDELNNSLMSTYRLHKQSYKCQIERMLIRNVNLRIERCARSLVSCFTRTILRKEAKEALKGSLQVKSEFLEKINLVDYTEFGKVGSKIEIYKSMAFQLGITLALIDGIELYTKEDVAEKYSNLSNYLLRKPEDPSLLNEFIQKFVLKLKL